MDNQKCDEEADEADERTKSKDKAVRNAADKVKVEEKERKYRNPSKSYEVPCRERSPVELSRSKNGDIRYGIKAQD